MNKIKWIKFSWKTIIYFEISAGSFYFEKIIFFKISDINISEISHLQNNHLQLKILSISSSNRFELDMLKILKISILP